MARGRPCRLPLLALLAAAGPAPAAGQGGPAAGATADAARLAALRKSLLAVAEDAGRAAALLRPGAAGKPHGPEAERQGLSPRQLEQLERLERSWAAARSAVEGAAGPWPPPQHPESRPQHDADNERRQLSDILEPIIALGLIMAAIVIGCLGRQPFDLFSMDVHSPWEGAIAFTIASLVSILLVQHFLAGKFTNNPFMLYVAELMVSFVGTMTAVPVLLGSRGSPPPGVTLMSLAFLVFFVLQWLSSDASVLRYFPDPTEQKDTFMSALGMVILCLFMALLMLATSRAAYACGARGAAFEPAGLRFQQECVEYARRRRRRQLEGCPEPELPVPAPSALLVPVSAVGALTAVAVISLGTAVYKTVSAIEAFVVSMLRPLAPLFAWAGEDLPLDDISDTRLFCCFYLALACAAVYVWWLLRVTLQGYRQLFQNLARRRPFQGEALIKTRGFGVWTAEWSTYCSGALIGNAALAVVYITALLTTVFFLLSLESFWSFVFSFWSYLLLYGLTYVTRSFFFYIYIPKHVVKEDGTVLRHRVWALLFPTLTVLNFVLGATSGVIRLLVMFPYLLVQIFRVDFTLMSERFCDWDWSFQPFVCLALHSHRRLNPIMVAAVFMLREYGQAGGVSNGCPLIDNAASAPELTRPLIQEAARLPQGALWALQLRRWLRTLRRRLCGRGCQRGPAVLPPAPRPQSAAARARARWRLGATLALNPRLSRERSHALAARRANPVRESRSAPAGLAELAGPGRGSEPP